MHNYLWQLLEQIQSKLTQPADVPPGFMSALAERLDEAICATSRNQLDALSAQLSGLFEKVLEQAPEPARQAIDQTLPPESPENACYLLGQISFAQLLAAQAAERRVDDQFQTLMQDSRYQAYVAALGKQAQTGKELAQMSGETEETVSRKLKLLREQGVTDFRREGTRLYNFLTPAARDVLECSQTGLPPLQQPVIAQVVCNKPELLDRLRGATPLHLRHPLSFDASEPKAA